MQALVISLILFGQNQGEDLPVPPAPAITTQDGVVPSPEPVANAENLDEMKAWLLGRLILDMSFDAQKSADVERMIDRMNERQLRALIAAYKERAAQKEQKVRARDESAEKQAYQQAQLDKQQAEAYRDYLKREYDRRILHGQMTQNLVYENLLNYQRVMYMSNGTMGFSPLGFGGLGFGAVNYGGFGIGAPGFGGPVIYGPGMGVW